MAEVTKIELNKKQGYTATDVAYEIKTTVRESELEDILDALAPFAEFITYYEVQIR